MKFNLIPFEGSDVIKFEMTSEEIQSVFKIKPMLFRESEVALFEAENYIDMYHIYYEAGKNGVPMCASITFIKPAQVFLDNIQLMGELREKIEALFKNKFEDCQSEAYALFCGKAEMNVRFNFDQSVLGVHLARKGYAAQQQELYEKAFSEENQALREKKIQNLRRKIPQIVDKIRSKHAIACEYEIIRFQPFGKKYCHRFSQEYYEKSVQSLKQYFTDCTIEELRERDQKEYDNYQEVDIPLGASRIGGPVVDLPEDVLYPEGFYFLAQINCNEFKKHDPLGMLPSKGFLYFFCWHRYIKGLRNVYKLSGQ